MGPTDSGHISRPAMHADIVRKHCSGLWATLKDAQAAVDQAADELLSSISDSSSVAARLTPRSRETNKEALVNRLPEMQEGLESIKAQCRAELQETPFCHFTPQSSYLTKAHCVRSSFTQTRLPSKVTTDLLNFWKP